MSEAEIITQIKKAMLSGLIFVVKFTKKDKTLRTMTARMGVKKHLVHNDGRKSTTAHIEKYITVFDMGKKAYRTVNVETMTYFKCGNIKAEV